MKKLLPLLAFSIAIFSCKNNDDTKKSNKSAESITTALSPVSNWQITQEVADSMMAYYDTCTVGCHDSSEIKDWNTGTFKRIVSVLGAQDVSYVIARYRAADTMRYCTHRNFANPAHMASCSVAGHWTMIIKAKIPSAQPSATDSYLYYDIVTICPPPYDGTCSTAVFGSDSSAYKDSTSKKKL